MLTFSSIGNGGLLLKGAAKQVVAFPKAAKPADDSIILLSSPEEEPTKGVVSWPGEYDVAGITLRGIGQQEGQHVSFVLEADEIRVALPAEPLEEWSEADIERMGAVHVLALRGDADTKLAQKLLDEIDPRMVLLYPAPGGKMDQDLLKTCGGIGKEIVPEYKLKSTGSLPAEGREVAVLS